MRSLELEACHIDLLEGDIAHVHFRDGHLVTPEEVHLMFEAIAAEREGRKVLLLVSVGEGTTMTGEARTYASSPESNAYVAADAIIVRDFSHNLAANVFVRHNKPTRPIQMFGDKASAVDWLAQHHDLIDPA